MKHEHQCEQKALTWPADWSQERKDAFTLRFVAMNVPSQACPIIAGQIQALGTTEDVFVDYVILARAASDKATLIESDHIRNMAPIKAVSRLTNLKGRWEIPGLILLLILAIPMGLVSIPARILRWWRYRQLNSQISPTFALYVARRRKVLT
jgi:hypothetical protein